MLLVAPSQHLQPVFMCAVLQKTQTEAFIPPNLRFRGLMVMVWLWINGTRWFNASHLWHFSMKPVEVYEDNSQLHFALRFEHKTLFGAISISVQFIWQSLSTELFAKAGRRCDSPVGNDLLIRRYWDFLMDFVCVWGMITSRNSQRPSLQQRQERKTDFLIGFLQGSQNLSFSNTPAAS